MIACRSKYLKCTVLDKSPVGTWTQLGIPGVGSQIFGKWPYLFLSLSWSKSCACYCLLKEKKLLGCDRGAIFIIFSIISPLFYCGTWIENMMGCICCYSWGGEGRVRTRVGLRVVHVTRREDTFPQLLCLLRSITKYIFDQFWRTWIDCVCETAKTDKFICAINLPPRDTGLFITVSLYYICFLMKRELNHQTQSIVRIRKDREGGIVKEERKIKMESWEENELTSADTGRRGKGKNSWFCCK